MKYLLICGRFDNTLVEEDEDDDEQTSLTIVNGRAISVRFGHKRDSASANSLSYALTK